MSDENLSDIEDSSDEYSPTEAEIREALKESKKDAKEATSPKGNLARYNSHPYSYNIINFSSAKRPKLKPRKSATVKAEEDNSDHDNETDKEFNNRPTGTSLHLKTYLSHKYLPYVFIADFRCTYCKKDFQRKQNLYNHLYKTKCGKPPHIPGTNANYWEMDKRPFKCTQQNCNGSYSTERSLWMHLANRHGLQKSRPDIKRRATLGAVCRVRTSLPPKKKVAKKGTQNVSYINDNNIL